MCSGKKKVNFLKYITPKISTYFITSKNIWAQDSIYCKMGKDLCRLRFIQNGHEGQQKVWDAEYNPKQDRDIQ